MRPLTGGREDTSEGGFLPYQPGGYLKSCVFHPITNAMIENGCSLDANPVASAPFEALILSVRILSRSNAPYYHPNYVRNPARRRNTALEPQTDY